MGGAGEHFPGAARGEDLRRLREVRLALLRLHKALIEDERAAYERVRGRVTAGELLQLLINHEQFAWLRAFSELIVRMDELFDLKGAAEARDVAALFGQARGLLLPADEAGAHARRYAAALERGGAALAAHEAALASLAAGRVPDSSG
ncbi:MAG TPA: hypothetical protein VEY09_14850 [Pyrinomonadaceae bacterium]|nr:hypothetical protein [Pyrinomonadaceae bacterium]